MSIHTILSQEIVSDKTNRIYVRSKKYPNGGLIMGEEVDTFLKHLATRIVEEAQREERERLYNFLMDKQEFVTYKKDGGHGVAIPMSWIIDLGTKLQKMKGDI